MATTTQKIVAQIADVAKKTVETGAQIVEATVLSRNPDGSLNVTDGKGRCTRLAPKANVRVGQKIRLGTEPGIGQQTNLPAISLIVDPSSRPCPDDPRLRLIIGASWFGAVSESSVRMKDGWSSRDTIGAHATAPTAAFPRPCFLGVSGGGPYTMDGFLAVISVQNWRSGTEEDPDVASPELVFECFRGFMAFNTAGKIPDDSDILSATIRFTVRGGTQLSSAARGYIVPSTASDPPCDISTSWTAFDRTELASFALAEALAAPRYPTLEGFTVPLLPGDQPGDIIPYINRTGLTKFAVISGYDMNDQEPPRYSPPTVGQVASESVIFSTSPPTLPVLDITYKKHDPY